MNIKRAAGLVREAREAGDKLDYLQQKFAHLSASHTHHPAVVCMCVCVLAPSRAAVEPTH